MTTDTRITADELLRMSIPDKQVELVRGVLIVREPPGGRHGALSNDLAYRLTDFVKRGNLGTVFGQDTGFQIEADPDTVRAPDVAFVSKGRMPGEPPEAYPALAPDLAIEVLSPNDRPGEVLAKVGEWLGAGTRLVWVVGPGLSGRRQAVAPRSRRRAGWRGRPPRIQLPPRGALGLIPGPGSSTDM